MKIVTKNKRYIEVFERYLRSSDTQLSDVYNSYSSDKARAELLIKREMMDVDGYGYRIIGYNCNTFSCGYMYDDDDITFFVYHTAYDNRAFEVVEDE